MGLGLIGAGISAIGSIFGGASAARQAKKANRLLDDQIQDNEDWYERKTAEDYTRSADALDMLEKARDYADKAIRRSNAARSVSGGTDAQILGAMNAAGNVQSETLKGLAKAANAYKNSIESTYLRNKSALTGAKIEALNGKATNLQKAASNFANIGGSLIGAAGDGLTLNDFYNGWKL